MRVLPRNKLICPLWTFGFIGQYPGEKKRSLWSGCVFLRAGLYL
ncbi:hypothetical protein C4K09_1022 [Pseudomonas chlororaphis subsp. aureofaciens]|nr:hypothetical protein C4K09_1022 [Pseudomonas chlororaphis subsp. aureofaciens]